MNIEMNLKRQRQEETKSNAKRIKMEPNTPKATP